MTSDEIIYTAYDALAELGGVPFDKRQFKDRFKALDRGLPSEDEFIALSVWMGNCEIIHKLDQRGYPEDFKKRYEIPDLLAVYRYNDTSIPALIQVKTTNLAKPESIIQTKLKFSEQYYHRSYAYSERVRVPLLIAWLIEPWHFWFLFELGRFQRIKTAYGVAVLDAAKADLMCVLLGDAHIAFWKGSKLLIRSRKDAIGEPRGEGKGIWATITDVTAMNPENTRVPELTDLLGVAWLVLPNEEKEEEDETHLNQMFELEEENSVHGHQLLGAKPTYSADSGKPNYRLMLRNGSFPSKYTELLSAARFGVSRGIVRQVFKVRPDPWPAFLETLPSPET